MATEIYNLKKQAEHLDKLMGTQRIVSNNYVSVNNSSVNITPVVNLTPNTWMTFKFFGIISSNNNWDLVFSSANFDFSTNDVSVFYMNYMGHRSIENLGSGTTNSSVWRGVYFNDADSNNLIPFPSTSESFSSRMYLNGQGYFQTGANPTMQFGFTSNILDTDDFSVEAVSFEFDEATNIFSMS